MDEIKNLKTLLTDEEISAVIREEISTGNWLDITVQQRYQAIAKAQDAKTKRVIGEWLEVENLATQGLIIMIPREKYQAFKKWALGE